MYCTKHIIYIAICSLFFNFCWSQTPPTITATGDQAYCPLNPMNVATDFDIVNPDNIEIDVLHIQISTGYVRGEDTLVLTGSHPSVSASAFNTLEGKLTLTAQNSGLTGLNDLIVAAKDVVFSNNTATVSGERYFSFTLGAANYLTITGHYYEYVADLGITWTSAKIAAEGRNYYGLQGYLATVTYPEEATLTGEQAAGAGWIGGSDAATEGVWKWVTGPENGTVFWNGVANGSTPNFAFWNNGEPNQLGDEDYAHITAPNVGISGSWNDLSNTGSSSGDYQPKGYIVEYGGMPGDPDVNISASTKIYVPTVSISSATRCGAGVVTLTAVASTGTVLWFNAATGGVPTATGSTFSPSITNTTTFYAYATVNGCIDGIRTPAIATVKPIPTITATTDDSICESGSVTLTATASAGVINWYANPTGGIPIGTGNTFDTPSITTTTTYYVDATENGCSTLSRTPVICTVTHINLPTASTPQTFCDSENASISDLAISGINIKWYVNATGGVPLATTEELVNTAYYASQTVNNCESASRLAVDVVVHETVIPPEFIVIPVLQECDTALDSDDTNGFTIFDLTLNETILLNGKAASDFTFSYYTNSAYTSASKINNLLAFENTVQNGQTIYVRISNNLNSSCFTDSSFNIRVNTLPIIQPVVSLKNCDEDGNPDGFTDYNLEEANDVITNGNSALSVTYHLSFAEADNAGSIPVNPSPFNNKDTTVPNTVFARVENAFGCHRVATLNLQVSTTSFPMGYMQYLEFCDDDALADGLRSFDLAQVSIKILNDLPPQNLSVHYYKNLTDAQLEQSEIIPQNAYLSETPFSQTLFVRVENDDNGDCFGIGPYLTLTVHPRPEFEVTPSAIVCMNLPPIVLETFNPQDNYSYEWRNENGDPISNSPTASVDSGGTYSVIATSSFGCDSFAQTVTVAESIIAAIDSDDITIIDDSTNNSITINNQNNNLGIGDYEFALDEAFGTYQDEPFFDMVTAGVHTIYVRDKNNCGIAVIDISVIGYPKFFTPNNDGINDTWQINGVNEDFYPASLIYIFDRFGKLIIQIDPTGEGWNGFFNGEILPANDYWFSVQLIDKDNNIREKRGHFSLIRG